MTTVRVAGFLVQDISSPRNKVYGSIVWLDPATGEANMASAYGPMSQLRNKTLSHVRDHAPQTSARNSRPAVGHTPRSVADAFAARWDEKVSGRGYNTSLGGPVVVDVDGDLLIDHQTAVRVVFADHIKGVAASGTVAEVASAALGTQASTTNVAAPSRAARPALRGSGNAPVILPNGDPYYPRMIGGVTDVDLLRSARANDMAVGFYGAAGTGKSTAALAAFGDELISYTFHDDSTPASLIGSWVPDNSAPSGFSYRKGPLTRAAEEGRPFLADELSRAPQGTIPALFSLLDSRRELVLEDLGGEIVSAAPGFTVVATWNVEGIGVRALDPAMLRRLPIKVEVTHDYTAAERRGVNPSLLKVARNLATRRAAVLANGGFPTWVPSVPNLLASQTMLNAGLGEEVAVGALVAECPVDERLDDPDGTGTVMDVIREVFDVDSALTTAAAA